MQIIQCDNCGKRYKVRDNKSSGKTSNYKCNACFHMIVINNSAHTENPFDVTTKDSPPLDNEPFKKEISQPKYDAANLEDPSKAPIGRSLSLRAKFNLIIGTLLACALVLIYIWSESRMQKEAEEQVLDKAQLLLTTMEASRNFTSTVVKPTLYQALPGRFITEGMSSSFGARNIFERIRKTYPQYYFKHAAPYPRNKDNQADLFEMNIINKFNKDKDLKEWRGYRVKDNEELYSIMKPIVAEQRCMRCHSEPAKAPQELLEKYGDKNGFGRSVGEVIGTLTVSVPASVVMAKADTNAMAFIGMVALFFGLLIIIANIFFSMVVIKPIKYLAESADEISNGKFDAQINTSGGDEIAKLARAFDRMKISIKMAFEQLAR